MNTNLIIATFITIALTIVLLIMTIKGMDVPLPYIVLWGFTAGANLSILWTTVRTRYIDQAPSVASTTIKPISSWEFVQQKEVTPPTTCQEAPSSKKLANTRKRLRFRNFTRRSSEAAF